MFGEHNSCGKGKDFNLVGARSKPLFEEEARARQGANSADNKARSVRANLREQISGVSEITGRQFANSDIVPSKFFGALAVGRWIREYHVGWVLDRATIDETVAQLLLYAREPRKLEAMFHHCHAVYQKHFSKRSVADQWDAEMRALLGHSQVTFVDNKELASRFVVPMGHTSSMTTLSDIVEPGIRVHLCRGKNSLGKSVFSKQTEPKGIANKENTLDFWSLLTPLSRAGGE